MTLPTPAEVYAVAVKNGHYDNKYLSTHGYLNRIEQEIYEAKQAYMDDTSEGQPHCLSEELADIVLVTFSLAEHLGIDIISAIKRKHDKNKG